MTCDVFVSHSSIDATTANAVVHVLESNGVRCWIAPRDIEPGANYMSSITAAIRSAKVVVLVFSENANASPHVNREVQQAAELNLPIIPLRIHSAQPSDSLAYALVGRHWLDAINPPMEESLRHLTRAVLGILGSTAAEPAITVPSTFTQPAQPQANRPAADTVDEYGLPIRTQSPEKPPRVRSWVLWSVFGLAFVPFIKAASKRPNSGWTKAAVAMTTLSLIIFGLIGTESAVADTVGAPVILGTVIINWLAGRKWREQWWAEIEEKRASLAGGSRMASEPQPAARTTTATMTDSPMPQAPAPAKNPQATRTYASKAAADVLETDLRKKDKSWSKHATIDARPGQALVERQ